MGAEDSPEEIESNSEADPTDHPGKTRANIEFLLTCLADASSRDSRQIVLERLLPLIPVGHPPGLYIENLDSPDIRAHLRQTYGNFLNELKLRQDLRKLIESGAENVDLELGSFLISRLSKRNDITPASMAASIDRLAEPLTTRLDNAPSSSHEERVEIFQDYLFRECNLRGNTEDYYDPRNSYLTEILEMKRGIPVSLSVLCILIGKRVGLPMVGVNLPGHFIIKYDSPNYSIYLDPFNEGNLLTESDCLNFLIRQGLEPSAAYLSTATPITILKRMYRNLINYHSTSGDQRIEKVLRQHFSILEECSIRS